MISKVNLYFAAVTLVAAALLVTGWILGDPLPSGTFTDWPRFWTTFAACSAIGIVAEAVAVEFKIGLPGKQARSSIAFLPFIAALTLFSVPVAVLSIVLVLLVSQFGFRRIGLIKGLFNVAQGAIAGYAGGTVYRVLHGVGGGGDLNWHFAMAFGALAMTFFLTNMMLSSIALALLRNAKLPVVFRQVIGVNGANLRYDLFASPVAAVPVALGSPIVGMVLILLPLLLVQYSYVTNQTAFERSQQILRTLVKAIETRDPHTSGHSIRVTTLAKAVAADLGVAVGVMNHVEMAALLHDVGKIYPEFTDVLRKPYSLSPEEIILIRTHAARGAEMLESIPSVPPQVTAAVRHHHERWDGQGYPDGLTGRAIPLPARIIMLCDSVDAMLSDRPYRKALTISEVRAEVERCSGTQFDPDIVRMFLEKNTLERAVDLVAADAESDAWSHAMFS
jgi:putative nucleotidyltransferase with HDIG domain